MKNESDVKEWVRYADMDVLSANYLNGIQHPKPLEVICYHCQQAAEKMLKALILAHDGEIQKTHDLGLLTDELSSFAAVPEAVLDSADLLTPYGVKIRYPQDLRIEEVHAEKALADMETVYDFVSERTEGIAESAKRTKRQRLMSPFSFRRRRQGQHSRHLEAEENRG